MTWRISDGRIDRLVVFKAVGARDREIVAPLMQACFSPPAWGDRIIP